MTLHSLAIVAGRTAFAFVSPTLFPLSVRLTDRTFFSTLIGLAYMNPVTWPCQRQESATHLYPLFSLSCTFALGRSFNDEPSLLCQQSFLWFCSLSCFSRCSRSPSPTTFRLVISNSLTPRHRRLLPVSPSPQDGSPPVHTPHTSRRGLRLTLLTLPLVRTRLFGIAASCPQELLPNSQLGFVWLSSFHRY